MNAHDAARQILTDAGVIDDATPDPNYLVARIVAAIVHIGADRDDLSALLDSLSIGLEHDPATRELAARLVERVIVCGVVTDDQLRRRILWCPFEQRHQEMVIRFETWYAPTIWCCGCGDEWDAEEGRYPRPLARYWRRDAVRRNRRLWDRATYGPPPPPDFPWDDEDEPGMVTEQPRGDVL